ncbi:hypothetical protein C8A00DRAFT_34363 [Chaetomidium leptoderma]|uniref:Uncharacterized protein n=1 Tax=Chaetomidium leptoderma TaxID=669021 RepID=A0AAN6VJV8_9PEZI|nr:hypothetical protein C8A00DRAFT_34363 [Chaetomidium leptoderma]
MSLATTAPAQGNPLIPTLAEPSESEPGTGNATPRAAVDGEEKKKKRSLFGFGKKKTEEPAKSPAKSAAAVGKDAPTTRRTTTASPIQTDHAHFSPTSPGRSGFASSPRLASPAGSQIFERDVQESAALMPNSPAIPSHIQTEDHIPPVLDASSEAITDDHLNPDTVEIITHTSHQPASITVTGLSPHEPSWTDELAAFTAQQTTTKTTTVTTTTNTDTASNYGSFDATDVRRLSFISFADVVQSEHCGGGGGASQFSGAGSPSRDSMHLAGLTSLASVGINRSPSPMRSPVSSIGGGGVVGGGGTGISPPTSQSGSVKGLEMPMSSSPSSPMGGGGRRPPLGSPTSMMSMHLPVGAAGGGGGGEIAIETMRQALRRTGSGDLGGAGGGGGSAVRSFPASPI